MRTWPHHRVDGLGARPADGRAWQATDPRPGTCPPRPAAAFTLVEVILAIAIAVGILIVALHFYGQAADLRSRLLDESDRISSVRLLLERLTADLRAAYAQPQVGFTGDAFSLRFVVAGVPNSGGWNSMRYGRTATGGVEPDLTIVEYGAARVVEGTNSVVSGLTRREQSLLELPSALPVVTNQTVAGSVKGRLAATVPGVDQAPALTDSRIPLLDAVRFVQFSFWDGHGWTDRWDASSLPACVEVVLGTDPLPEGVDPLDYPYEIFRRVIYLPTSRATLSNSEPLDGAFE